MEISLSNNLLQIELSGNLMKENINCLHKYKCLSTFIFRAYSRERNFPVENLSDQSMNKKLDRFLPQKNIVKHKIIFFISVLVEMSLCTIEFFYSHSVFFHHILNCMID